MYIKIKLKGTTNFYGSVINLKYFFRLIVFSVKRMMIPYMYASGIAVLIYITSSLQYSNKGIYIISSMFVCIFIYKNETNTKKTRTKNTKRSKVKSSQVSQVHNVLHLTFILILLIHNLFLFILFVGV